MKRNKRKRTLSNNEIDSNQQSDEKKNKKILKVNNIHSLLNQENSELEYEAILNNPVLASFMSCKENMNQDIIKQTHINEILSEPIVCLHPTLNTTNIIGTAKNNRTNNRVHKKSGRSRGHPKCIKIDKKNLASNSELINGKKNNKKIEVEHLSQSSNIPNTNQLKLPYALDTIDKINESIQLSCINSSLSKRKVNASILVNSKINASELRNEQIVENKIGIKETNSLSNSKFFNKKCSSNLQRHKITLSPETAKAMFNNIVNIKNENCASLAHAENNVSVNKKCNCNEFVVRNNVNNQKDSIVDDGSSIHENENINDVILLTSHYNESKLDTNNINVLNNSYLTNLLLPVDINKKDYKNSSFSKLKNPFNANNTILYENASKIPLPELNWASNTDLWLIMRNKDDKYIHDYKYMHRHPGLEFQMRSILLDWLIEISHAYRLHRETFHLAVEYIDRFLTLTKTNMKIDRLQLIGITSLFLAAKVEEIYPPKLTDFASHMENYSNDNENAIMQFELLLLKTLNWQISPITANAWLNIYLQLATINTNENPSIIRFYNTSIVLPAKLHDDYIKTITLIDLCTFDMESLRYKYSQIAAAAMYHMIKPCELSLKTSGYNLDDLNLCINWMSPYADVIKDSDKKISLKKFSNIDLNDSHTIQMYHNYLEFLKDAQLRKTPSKSNFNEYSNLLTPPDSLKKTSSVFK